MHKKKTCASHRCAFASDDFCANTLGPPRRLISTLIRKALVVGDLPLREQLPLKVSTTHEGSLDALELCALGGAELVLLALGLLLVLLLPYIPLPGAGRAEKSCRSPP